MSTVVEAVEIGQTRTRMEIPLPFEIRQMIVQACDLSTFQALRLTSHAWAAASYDHLLLPTFTICRHKPDVQRLIDITSSPVVAPLAHKTIRTLEFVNPDIDYAHLGALLNDDADAAAAHANARSGFRAGFVPRSAHVRNTPTTATPTDSTSKPQDADLALAHAELDALARLATAHAADSSLTNLTRALSALPPNVQALHLTSRNPFTHPLLTQLWARTAALATVSAPPDAPAPALRFEALLQALAASGAAGAVGELVYEHVPLQPLPHSLSTWLGMHLRPALRGLEVLRLRGVERGNGGRTGAMAYPFHGLLSMAREAAGLRELRLGTAAQARWRLAGYGGLHWPCLAVLQVDNCELFYSDFAQLLAQHAATLTHLSIGAVFGVDFRGREFSFRELLVGIRGGLVKLQRFQLAGSVRYLDGEEDESYYIPRMYDDNWDLIEKSKFNKADALERWIVERRRWTLDLILSSSIEEFMKGLREWPIELGDRLGALG